MSRITELIAEYCPNGVEYKPLKEVCIIERGKRVTKNMLTDEGLYPVYQNCLTPMGFYNESNVPANTPIVIVGGAAGEIGYVDVDFWAADDCVSLKGNNVLNRYVYHCLLMNAANIKSNVRRASIPRLPRNVIENLTIPVPPIEVQREIVRILDNFTELTAELTARQKQYEYYRDYLLSFPEITSLQTVNVERERERRSRAVRWLTLNKIASTFRGEYITKSGTTEGSIPVILGGQEPAYYINKSNHSGEVVVISRSGASAGFVSYWNQDVFITDGFGYDANPDIMSPRFLYYTLKNKEQKLNAMKRGAGVPHISGAALGEMLFPVPSYEEQERIVSILDRFDALCNDISEGIPAEIEARRQQYEYYRDKLLTFKEKT